MRPLHTASALLKLFGLDLNKTTQSVRGLRPFVRDYRRWQGASDRPELPMTRFYPCLADRWGEAGDLKDGYFHQDLLVAQRIHDLKPRRHIDIGSRIDGFVAHVASFRAIEIFDIRPLSFTARNITFGQCDLSQTLPLELIGCSDSVSCLHALEHFGLGRYGDPIDPDGHKKALANLISMLQPGGHLFLSVPIGPQRVEFNAHRVFHPRHIVNLAGPSVALDRFSYIDDAGHLHEGCPITGMTADEVYGCNYGVGIFEFKKQGASV